MTTGDSQDWCGQGLAHGRYLVTAKLGEGGMGVVYRARDLNIDAEVVIKVPLRSMLADAEFTGRFTREIRSLVRLSHPRIVKVTDVGEHDGLPFAVMQYLPGGSLEGRHPGGREGASWAADPVHVPGWLEGIADALDYVHAEGYVHRDVKPGNILFDGHGRSFLGDFGVVKVVTSAAEDHSRQGSMTGAGMLLGTPEYMAPELIMGESVDGRVDQYALAVTIYESLSGRRPFEDEVKTKLLVLQTSKPPPPLEGLCPWVPSSVSQAVHRGLAKDPNERYPTCAALAAAVVAAIQAEFAGRPERVRTRCLSCGKTLALSPADFTRLTQASRRIACPSCKTPLAAPAAAGGPGARNEPEPRPRERTVVVGSPPPSPAAGSGGTVAIDTPRPGSTVAIDTGARGATIALDPRRTTERVASPFAPASAASSRSRGTVILGSPSGLEGRGGPGSADALASGGGETAAGPAAVSSSWSIVGASVGVTVVVLALVVWGLRPGRKEANVVSTGAVPSGSAGAAPSAAPRSNPSSSPALPAPAAEPARAAVVPPVMTPPVLTITDSTPGSRPVVVPMVEQPGKTADSLAARTPTSPPAEPPTAPVQATTVAETETEPSPDENAPPLKGSVPLEKILSAPDDYANRTVVLTDIYCIAAAATHRDGWVSLGIIESDLDLHLNGSRASLRVGHWKSFELAVDVQLAKVLVSAGMLGQISYSPPTRLNWRDKVAIVTVVVRKPTRPGMSPCQIVKLEFATRVTPEAVTIARKRRLKVIYRTLTVSAAGAEPGTGKDEEWAPKTGRLRHITTQYNKMIEVQKRMASDAKWNQFSSQFNNMMSQGIQNAARQNNAAEIRGRQAITPADLR